MSFEAGNRFEIKYFILQILKVIEEDIRSVTLEALGDDEKGTDIWIENKDGTRESQQCKGRYANSDNWNFSALDQYDIFKNWKYQLDRDTNFFERAIQFRKWSNKICRFVKHMSHFIDKYIL